MRELPEVNPSVGEDGRYEVIRTSDDRRLPNHVRRLVLRRDRYRCVFCAHGGLLEVDHIIPWSAGGSNDMDNLRTLCQPCNQLRSNFRVPADDHRRLPTAHECVYCNRELLGDSELTAVYCLLCNKKAPGVPLNRPEQELDYDQFVDEDWSDPRIEELAELADEHRGAALATIRKALTNSNAEKEPD